MDDARGVVSIPIWDHDLGWPYPEISALEPCGKPMNKWQSCRMPFFITLPHQQPF